MKQTFSFIKENTYWILNRSYGLSSNQYWYDLWN